MPQQRERAVVELHHHALQRLLRLLVGDLQQLQDHRLVLAEHFAAGDPEQQAVADLAGGAGDGDANGGFHREDSWNGVRIVPRKGTYAAIGEYSTPAHAQRGRDFRRRVREQCATRAHRGHFSDWRHRAPLMRADYRASRA